MRPEARWQSAGELAHALQSWMSAQTQPAGAAALAAFMRDLFDDPQEQAEERSSRATLPKEIEPVRVEPARHEPWDGSSEHTSPNGMLMEQLAAGMERGVVRQADASQLATLVHSLVVATIHASLLSRASDAVRAEDSAAALWEFCLRAVRADAPV